MATEANATPLSIALELRLQGDELSGRVIGPGGEEEFSGWLGLIGALDELVRAHGTDGPNP